jgi:hypothetical protein
MRLLASPSLKKKNLRGGTPCPTCIFPSWLPLLFCSFHYSLCPFINGGCFPGPSQRGSRGGKWHTSHTLTPPCIASVSWIIEPASSVALPPHTFILSFNFELSNLCFCCFCCFYTCCNSLFTYLKKQTPPLHLMLMHSFIWLDYLLMQLGLFCNTQWNQMMEEK